MSFSSLNMTAFWLAGRIVGVWRGLLTLNVFWKGCSVVETANILILSKSPRFASPELGVLLASRSTPRLRQTFCWSRRRKPVYCRVTGGIFLQALAHSGLMWVKLVFRSLFKNPFVFAVF